MTLVEIEIGVRFGIESVHGNDEWWDAARASVDSFPKSVREIIASSIDDAVIVPCVDGLKTLEVARALPGWTIENPPLLAYEISSCTAHLENGTVGESGLLSGGHVCSNCEIPQEIRDAWWPKSAH